jgi:ATP-dependent DNA helicase DinG
MALCYLFVIVRKETDGADSEADRRFTKTCLARLRAEIAAAQGNEIFALGWLQSRAAGQDEETSPPAGREKICRITITARGNGGRVLALGIEAGNAAYPADPQNNDEDGADGSPPDVFIHNHPSGFLVPSDDDLIISGRAAENGVGAYIVDNQVERVYVVAEPVRRRKVKKLNADRLLAALREDGAVARRLESYEPRQAQLDLMELVIRAFNEDALAAAEAGTGVGKSFAYLLPALRYAIENDERIVISTATITLQQQLFEKDIPLVVSAAGKKVKVVLMKGRGNFLCRRRLEDAVREPDIDESGQEELRRLVEWAETSRTGSRSDLSFLPAEALWSRVCSEADLCISMRCPERERCFVLALRKAAADARVIVVNHHLLFADLAARHEGAGYEGTVVLPPYTRVIIDEAHTIESAATSFFSSEFSRVGVFRQLGRLYRKRRANRQGLLVRLCAFLSPGEDRLNAAAAAVDAVRAAVEALDRSALELCGMEGVFRLSALRDNTGAESVLFPPMRNLRKKILALAELIRSLLEQTGGESAEDTVVWETQTVIRKLEKIAEICAAFTEYRERPDKVMWIERRQSAEDKNPWAVFTQSPVELAADLKAGLFAPNKTVVCVSATLTANDDFGYWAERSGFAQTEKRHRLAGCFPSPFPYSSAVLLAVPSDAPLPDEEGYQDFVDRSVGRLTAVAGGSALVLFTSYQSLKSAWFAALPELQSLGIRCLKQGDDDRSRLLKTFLADRTSVLFATDSFWEGVDAPGDTLRLVILCRLPFKSPGDPVFEARREAVERKGGNPFMNLSLPGAVMKFRQGFGRLMRRGSDRGVVAVLDGRIIKKRYGSFFLNSLPETKTSFTDFESVLRDTENFLYR